MVVQLGAQDCKLHVIGARVSTVSFYLKKDLRQIIEEFWFRIGEIGGIYCLFAQGPQCLLYGQKHIIN